MSGGLARRLDGNHTRKGTVMTTAVGRSIPPQRLINLVNPVVRAVLQSPLHRTLDSALVVLHIAGRKTGRRYDIPVSYVDIDGHLIVITQHTWRVNARGADVEVTYRGHRQMMRLVYPAAAARRGSGCCWCCTTGGVSPRPRRPSRRR